MQHGVACPICVDLLKDSDIESLRVKLLEFKKILNMFGEFVTDMNEPFSFYFETWIDPNSPDEEKLSRNDIRDATHRQIHTLESFMLLDSGWFFWSWELKRWFPARECNSDPLIKEIDELAA